MLSDALHNHRGALAASLKAEYGIRLDHHDLSVLELADLTFWLPDGSALWRSVGGPRARTRETDALLQVEYQIRVLQWQNQAKKSAKKPKPPEPIPYAHAAEAEADRQAVKAERWHSRQRQ